MAEANQILHKTGEKLGETLDQVRRTTMRASKKVQSCFDARLGSLIAGIVMSVISGLAVLVCIGGLITINVLVNLGYDLSGRHPPNDFDGPRPGLDYTFPGGDVMAIVNLITGTAVVLIFSLLDFSFSVVLANGASKRKIGQLKAYFVYGILKNAVILIESTLVSVGSLALLLCGVNIVITLTAYRAYKNLMKSAEDCSKRDNEVADKEVKIKVMKM